MLRSLTVYAALFALAAVGAAQSWSNAYEEGLVAARSGLWADARQAFQQAAAFRPEDFSGPTTLPGPVSERRRWRNGAPYSANFMAAYAGYQAALATKTTDDRVRSLGVVAAEFETLLLKKQTARETFFFLNAIYVAVGNTAKAMQLDAIYNSTTDFGWKVDLEVVSPADKALIAQAMPAGQSPTKGAGATTNVPTIKPGDLTGNPNSLSGGLSTPLVGKVAPVATKFALVIGNSEGRMGDELVPFAAGDAAGFREALVTHSGYPEENVDLVINATARQILASARALAERVGDGNTVLIFFAGVGVNLDGKDFLAGVEAQSNNDPSSMVSKADLYRLFMSKGARIFSFFEAHRPIVNGRYFGMEVPFVGAISQSQATLPGERVYSKVKNEKNVGLFGDALVGVLAELRSNRVPILEFGWQVFYRIRRGDSGTTGGGSRQTPTLPVLSNLASDARF